MLLCETNFFFNSSIESFYSQVIYSGCFTVYCAGGGDGTGGSVDIEAATDVTPVQRIEDITLATYVIVRGMDFDDLKTDRYTLVDSSTVIATAEDWRVVIDVMDLKKKEKQDKPVC